MSDAEALFWTKFCLTVDIVLLVLAAGFIGWLLWMLTWKVYDDLMEKRHRRRWYNRDGARVTKQFSVGRDVSDRFWL